MKVEGVNNFAEYVQRLRDMLTGLEGEDAKYVEEMGAELHRFADEKGITFNPDVAEGFMFAMSVLAINLAPFVTQDIPMIPTGAIADMPMWFSLAMIGALDGKAVPVSDLAHLDFEPESATMEEKDADNNGEEE